MDEEAQWRERERKAEYRERERAQYFPPAPPLPFQHITATARLPLHITTNALAVVSVERLRTRVNTPILTHASTLSRTHLSVNITTLVTHRNTRVEPTTVSTRSNSNQHIKARRVLMHASSYVDRRNVLGVQ